jgi:hypothetical protein
VIAKAIFFVEEGVTVMDRYRVNARFEQGTWGRWYKKRKTSNKDGKKLESTS